MTTQFKKTQFKKVRRLIEVSKKRKNNEKKERKKETKYIKVLYSKFPMSSNLFFRDMCL